MAKDSNPTAVKAGESTYLRIPIRTKIITRDDDIAAVADEFTRQHRREGDVIVVSESVVAVSQGRAIAEKDIKIGLLAKILWRCVRKVPYGIGLRRPSSMQCAINECGALRILLASMVGGITRLFGRRGDFYRIAGKQAAMIDAASTSPLQPDCVILGPKDPDKEAEAIKKTTGCAAAVMDINDIGGSWVVGASSGVDRTTLEAVMKDNPMGQKTEQTPVCLVRKMPG